jgi:hypothetical protein
MKVGNVRTTDEGNPFSRRRPTQFIVTWGEFSRQHEERRLFYTSNWQQQQRGPSGKEVTDGAKANFYGKTNHLGQL